MNLHRHLLPFRNLLPALAVLPGLALQAAVLTPTQWRHTQALEVDATGLVRVNLPPETLDAARPALEDLRIVDGAGNEVPYAIQQMVPSSDATHRPAEFNSAIGNGTTTVTLRTGTTAILNGITLETPAEEFIKALRIEGSHDGKTWQELATGLPIFRQRGGAEKLHVSFEGGAPGRNLLPPSRSPMTAPSPSRLPGRNCIPPALLRHRARSTSPSNRAMKAPASPALPSISARQTS